MKLTKQETQKLMMQAALICCLLTVPVLYAVAGPHSPGGDPGGAIAPIDGGISLLVAAGIGYGIKKAHERRNSLKEGAGKN